MGVYSKIKKRWKGMSNQTGTSLLGKVGSSEEYLNVLYAPISENEINELENYISNTKKCEEKFLKNYIEVLSEHNGAVLYGGSILFFGSTNHNKSVPFTYPSSIIRFNSIDRVSSLFDNILYIGNAVHKSKDNINFYYNLENGMVFGCLKGDIVISWKDLEEFYEYIFSVYDDCYGDDGVHKFYNNKEQLVFYNVQLFDEEKN